MVLPSSKVIYNSQSGLPDTTSTSKALVSGFETALDTTQMLTSFGGMGLKALAGQTISNPNFANKVLGQPKNYLTNAAKVADNFSLADDPLVKGVKGALKGLDKALQENVVMIKDRTTLLGKTFQALNNSAAEVSKQLKVLGKGIVSSQPVQQAIRPNDPVSNRVSRASANNLTEETYTQINALENRRNKLSGRFNANAQKIEELEKKGSSITPQEKRRLDRLRNVQVGAIDRVNTTDDQLKGFDKLLKNREKILDVETKIQDLARNANKANLGELDKLNLSLERRIKLEGKLLDTQAKAGQTSARVVTNNANISKVELETTEEITRLAKQKAGVTSRVSDAKTSLSNQTTGRGFAEQARVVEKLTKEENLLSEAIEAQGRKLKGLNVIRERSNNLVLNSVDDVVKYNQVLTKQALELDKLAKSFQAYALITDKILAVTAITKSVLTVTEGFRDLTRAVNGSNEALQLMQTQGFDSSVLQQFDLLKGLNADEITNFATRAVAEFNNFEETLRQVGTVFETSLNIEDRRKELDKFGVTIQNLVKNELKNTVTETEALAATYEALSAGFVSANDSTQVMVAGLKLAASSGANSGEVMQLLAKTMNAYGISASGAAETAAKLNGIVENGITTVAELSQGFGQLSSIADAAGVKLEDSGAALAVLTTRGTSTSQAMTQLQSLFNTLVDPSFTDRLSKLKIDFKVDKAKLETEGLTKVLEQLNEAVGGSSVKFAQLFPEVQAYRAVIGLTADSVSNLERVSKRLVETTAKNLEEVFSIRLDDSQITQFTQIVNTLNSTMINIGRSLAPIFQEGIESVAKYSDAIAKAVEKNEGLIVGLVKGSLALKAFEGATGAIVSTALKLLGILTTYRLLSGKLFRDVGNLFAVTGNATEGLENTTGVLSKMKFALNNNAIAASGNVTAFQKFKLVLGNLLGIGAKSSGQIKVIGENGVKASKGVAALGSEVGKTRALFPDFGKAIDSLASKFKGADGKFIGFKESLDKVWTKVTSSFVGGTNKAGKGIEGLTSKFKDADGKYLSFSKTFSKVWDKAFKELGKATNIVTKPLGALFNTLGSIASIPINPFVAGIVAVTTAVTASVVIWKQFDKEIEKVRNQIDNTIVSTENLAKEFSSVQSQNKSLIEQSGSSISTQLSQITGKYAEDAKRFLEQEKGNLAELDKQLKDRDELQRKLTDAQKNPVKDEKQINSYKADLQTLNEKILAQQQKLEDSLDKEGEAVKRNLKLRIELQNQALEGFLESEEEYIKALANIEQRFDLLGRVSDNLSSILKSTFKVITFGLFESQGTFDKFFDSVGAGLKDFGNSFSLGFTQYFGGEFGDQLQVEKSQVALEKSAKNMNAIMKESYNIKNDINIVDNVLLANEDAITGKKYEQIDLQKELNNLWKLQLGLTKENEDALSRFNAGLKQAKDNRQQLLNTTNRDIEFLEKEISETKLRVQKFDLTKVAPTKVVEELNEQVSGEDRSSIYLREIVKKEAKGLTSLDTVINKAFFDSLNKKDLEKFYKGSVEERKEIISRNDTVTPINERAIDALANSEFSSGLATMNEEELKAAYIGALDESGMYENLSGILSELEKQVLLLRENKEIIEKGLKNLEVLGNVGKFVENFIDVDQKDALKNTAISDIDKAQKDVDLYLGAVKKVSDVVEEKETTVEAEMETLKETLGKFDTEKERAYAKFKEENKEKIDKQGLNEEQIRARFNDPSGIGSGFYFKESNELLEKANKGEKEAVKNFTEAFGLSEDEYKILLSTEDSQALLSKPLQEAVKEFEEGNITATEALKEVRKTTQDKEKLGGLGKENIKAALDLETSLIKQSRQELIENEQAFVNQMTSIYEGLGLTSAELTKAITDSKEKALKSSYEAEVEILERYKEFEGQKTKEQILEQERKVEDARIAMVNARYEAIRVNAQAELRTEREKLERLEMMNNNAFMKSTKRLKEFEQLQQQIRQKELDVERKILEDLKTPEDGKEVDQKLIALQEAKLFDLEFKNNQVKLNQQFTEFERNFRELEDRNNFEAERANLEASLGFVSTISNEREQQRIQRENLSNYRAFLKEQYDLTKKNGGDLLKLQQELALNELQIQKQKTDEITALINTDYQKRIELQDMLTQRIAFENSVLERNLELNRRITESTVEALDIASGNSILPAEQLKLEEAKFKAIIGSLDYEYENRKRSLDIQLSQNELEVERQELAETEKKRVVDELVELRKKQVLEAEGTKEIEKANNALKISLENQKKVTEQVEFRLRIIKEETRAKNDQLELELKLLDVNKQLQKVNLAKQVTSNIKQQFDSSVDLLRKIIALQKEYDPEGVPKVTRSERYKEEVKYLEIQQKVQSNLLELENQGLLLQARKLEIEEQFTRLKNEQLILEKELQLMESKKKVTELESEKTTLINRQQTLKDKSSLTTKEVDELADLDSKLLELNTRLKLEDKRIQITERMIPALEEAIKQNSENTKQTVKLLETQVNQNKTTLDRQQRYERAENIITSANSPIEDKNKAKKDLKELSELQQKEPDKIAEQIKSLKPPSREEERTQNTTPRNEEKQFSVEDTFNNLVANLIKMSGKTVDAKEMPKLEFRKDTYKGGGVYYADTNTVVLPEKLKQDIVDATGAGFELLVHELRHWKQDVGLTNGRLNINNVTDPSKREWIKNTGFKHSGDSPDEQDAYAYAANYSKRLEKEEAERRRKMQPQRGTAFTPETRQTSQQIQNTSNSSVFDAGVKGYVSMGYGYNGRNDSITMKEYIRAVVDKKNGYALYWLKDGGNIAQPLNAQYVNQNPENAEYIEGFLDGWDTKGGKLVPPTNQVNTKGAMQVAEKPQNRVSTPKADNYWKKIDKNTNTVTFGNGDQSYGSMVFDEKGISNLINPNNPYQTVVDNRSPNYDNIVSSNSPKSGMTLEVNSQPNIEIKAPQDVDPEKVKAVVQEEIKKNEEQLAKNLNNAINNIV